MDTVGLILGGVIGVLVGAVAGWLLADRKSRIALASMQTDLAVAQERSKDALSDLQIARTTLEEQRSDLTILQSDRASLEARLNAEKEQVAMLRDNVASTLASLKSVQEELNKRMQERSTLTANLEAEKKSLADQREQLAAMSVRLKESFSELSVEALKQNTGQFMTLAEQKFKTLQTEAAGSLEQKKAEMQQILQPMQQTLDLYKTKLDDIEKSRSQAYVDIKQHLTEVATTQKNLSVETRQLVQALRKPQGRGRWGELTLKRLFEMAGMANRVTFLEQVTTDDGKYRPDCIVELPDERQVIIDSKCVIDAFLDASECTDEALRATHLVRHAKQIRSRMEELSKKAYWDQFDKAPDFVVMFLPGEAFLYAAVELEPDLIEDALTSRVIVAAPSALLGLLRIIEHGWRQKQIEQSANEIRDLAGALYERINKLASHFSKLGDAINSVNKRYNETVGSLEKNVLSSARKMSELGIGDGKPPVAELEEVNEHVRDLSSKSWVALPETVESEKSA
jgi:DNA recombination protein RmuC